MQDTCSAPISAHKSVAIETAEALLTQLSFQIQELQKLGTSCLFVDLDVIVAAFGVEPPPAARCEEVGNAL